MKWPFAAGLSLLLGSAPAHALDPSRAVTQYGHSAFTAREGLPQNSVQAILQTRDGFLWLGTQEGLVRFDGIRFALFDDKNEPAFRGRDVRKLCEDADGALWIGTLDGLIRLKDGVFTRFDQKSGGLPHNRITSLFVDRKNRLWVGTDRGLLLRVDDRFVTPPELSGQQVVLAMAQTADALWFGTDGNGLLRLTDGLETFTTRDGLSSNGVRALLVARDGRLWIGTRTGVGRFENGRVVSVPGPWDTSSQPVSSIVEDRQGNLWVGTEGGGVARVAPGGRIAVYSEEQGLTGSIVISLYEDREGSLWIGTEVQGLNRLRDVSFSAWGKPEGLPQENFLPVLEDRGGTLWIGSYGGGLLRADKEGFQGVSGVASGLTGEFIASLLEDRQGNLWVGTDDKGLFRGTRGVFRFVPTYPPRGKHDRVLALHEDKQGALWFGTYGNGLARLQGGLVTRYGKDEGLSSNMISAIAEDQAGRLWVGTEEEGLNLLENGRFKSFRTEQGLGHDTVFCIRPDRDGALWIGTPGGLTRYKGGRFYNVTRSQGLFDDLVYQILEDDLGNFWMSCNKGIFRVSKKELNDLAEGRRSSVSSVSYGTGDGMRVAECNGHGQPAGWRRRDGTLWFPTPRGAVRVDPKRILRNELAPPVAIEEVTIDKRPYSAGADLVAPPGDGEIEVHYTGLSLLEPDEVRFKYRLVGFDRDWVDAGTRRVAYYTNIPPDRYRFEVIAANNDGVWNETGAALVFELRPHFYQARWFHVLLVFALGGLVFAAYQARIRQMAARERLLASLVKDRTRELEQANQMLARFSYLDAVTGIANRRNFDDGMDLEWRRLLREGGPLSLVMIDIDHFKAYNDTYGHQKGDECLKTVAQTLRLALHRPGDLCARYGGEEFGVILPGTDAQGAFAVADGLRRSVEDLAVPHSGSSVAQVVTISVGVATVQPQEGGSGAALIQAADQALYQSKRTGRNRATAAALPPAAVPAEVLRA